MLIDIRKGYRQYTPDELRDYAYKGLLSCGEYELDGFLEYIFQGMISEEVAEEVMKGATEDSYREGWSEGYEEARERFEEVE